MKKFDLNQLETTKYLFFTGKGGVGKTSTACATALKLADNGMKVLLVSTDPASNLQDVFSTQLSGKETEIKEVNGLYVVNLDPVEAAYEYKESVIAPYRGKLPQSVLDNMEEQLSGSCTVEIAAFNEFSNFLTNDVIASKYDHIIFDTAPTGHTLRMLQLPSAWSNFISESSHGASCLGQLSGLEDKKEVYKHAVETLSDGNLTTLVLIARPEDGPLQEANRASNELSEIGVKNQLLVVNGVIDSHDDDISESLFQKQQKALSLMPTNLKNVEQYYIPLRSYNITGLSNIRSMLTEDKFDEAMKIKLEKDPYRLKDIIDDMYNSEKKVIFTMGKGGVGKTTLAAAIAVGLADKGKKVHLATTDPAAHLKNIISETQNITMSYIDEEKELKEYQDEVISKAKETMGADDIAYVEEDLRSPCTQEIAVFRAFAQIVNKADDQIVVIDTAPTGHTLLLLDATQSYHKEIERSQGDVPESVRKLLPRLRNEKETEVIIVTLPEATPVYEATRLEEDLERAGINNKWWIVNSSLYSSGVSNSLLKAKASSEIPWINEVREISDGNVALVSWKAAEVVGDELKKL